jgi:hypothetical protein
MKMLALAAGVFSLIAMGPTAVKADTTPTPSPTEKTIVESSSGSAEAHEGYEHQEHHGKKGDDCDDVDENHSHGADYGKVYDSYGYSHGYNGYPSYIQGDGDDYSGYSYGFGYGANSYSYDPGAYDYAYGQPSSNKYGGAYNYGQPYGYGDSYGHGGCKNGHGKRHQYDHKKHECKHDKSYYPGY